MVRLLLIAALWSVAASAQAADFITARAWHDDPTNAQPFAQVTAQPFTPYTHSLARGFYPGTVWMRLHVDASAAHSDTLLLRISPNHLDTIELIDPAAPSARERLAGDRVHPDEYEVPGLTYNFHVPRATPRDLWLRVKTSGPVSVQTSLVEPDEHAHDEARLAIASTLFVAGEAALLLVALFNWVFHRDRLSGLYALAQFAIICSAGARLGLLRIAFGSVLGTALDPISALAFFGIGLFGLAFNYRLLQQCVRTGWSFNLLRPQFAAWVVVFALYFAGWKNEALRIGVPLLMLGVLGAACVAAIEKPLPPDPVPPIPRWVLLLTYVLLAVFTAPSSTPVISSILKPSEGSFPPIILAGMGGGALILALVMQRRRREENLKHELAVKADAERTQRVEQSNFVAMLAHELNSPLSVIGLLADANTRQAPVPGNLPAAASSAIDEMRAVIDKCVQATRVEESGLVLAREECDLRALVHASSVRLASERFRIDVPQDADTWVDSDPAVLGTIVTNLLDNALKYGAPGEPVDIVLRPAQGGERGLELRVSHPPGAAGMPDPARVFRKFYRSEGASAFRGSGLGLYISSKLASLLGARLTLETGDGRVTFALCIPASVSADMT